ncbi:MAG: hypothetical protein KAT46_01900 [Deltaproteobacteria bacterium]|nr:hypothetical protein [Deltaproteobacteria bacterium]
MENFDEADKVLAHQLEEIQKRPYSELVSLMGVENIVTCEGTGESGVEYEAEVESVWNGAEGGDIRVNVVLFEKGFNSCVPVTSSFVMRPDNSVLSLEELPEGKVD